jgi:hypothetical protein
MCGEGCDKRDTFWPYPLEAVPVSELYGVLDQATRDWTDGLLSNIFREVNKPTDKKERKYIVFDGMSVIILTIQVMLMQYGLRI